MLFVRCLRKVCTRWRGCRARCWPGMLNWLFNSVFFVAKKYQSPQLSLSFSLEFVAQINCHPPSRLLPKSRRLSAPSSWFIHRKEWPLRIPGPSTPSSWFIHPTSRELLSWLLHLQDQNHRVTGVQLRTSTVRTTLWRHQVPPRFVLFVCEMELAFVFRVLVYGTVTIGDYHWVCADNE